MSGSCVLQNPGDVEEQGPPRVIKSQAVSRRRKRLAWEPRDEQFESWQRGRFDLLDVPEGSVFEMSLICLNCPFVRFRVPHAREADSQFPAGVGQPQLESPDPGTQ